MIESFLQAMRALFLWFQVSKCLKFYLLFTFFVLSHMLSFFTDILEFDSRDHHKLDLLPVLGLSLVNDKSVIFNVTNYPQDFDLHHSLCHAPAHEAKSFRSICGYFNPRYTPLKPDKTQGSVEEGLVSKTKKVQFCEHTVTASYVVGSPTLTVGKEGCKNRGLTERLLHNNKPQGKGISRPGVAVRIWRKLQQVAGAALAAPKQGPPPSVLPL